MAVDWTALVRQRGFVPPREFEDIGISEKAQGENAPGFFCAVSQARTSSLMMPAFLSTGVPDKTLPVISRTSPWPFSWPPTFWRNNRNPLLRIATSTSTTKCF